MSWLRNFPRFSRRKRQNWRWKFVDVLIVIVKTACFRKNSTPFGHNRWYKTSKCRVCFNCGKAFVESGLQLCRFYDLWDLNCEVKCRPLDGLNCPKGKRFLGIRRVLVTYISQRRRRVCFPSFFLSRATKMARIYWKTSGKKFTIIETVP